MRLLRMIPEHRRKLLRELLSFGLVGGINTAFGFLIFNLLFGMGSLTANAISTAAATVTSFILNRHITYRDRVRTPLRREVPMFAAFNLVGLGIQQGVMALAKVSLGLQETNRLELNMVRIVSVGLGTIFLLLSYRTFVFKPVSELAVAVPVSVPPAPVGVPVQVLAADDDFAELTDPLEAEISQQIVLDGLLDDEAVRSTL